MLAGSLSERLSGLHFTQDLELEFFGKLTTSECHNGSFRKGYHSLTHCLILGVHSTILSQRESTTDLSKKCAPCLVFWSRSSSWALVTINSDKTSMSTVYSVSSMFKHTPKRILTSSTAG